MLSPIWPNTTLPLAVAAFAPAIVPFVLIMVVVFVVFDVPAFVPFLWSEKKHMQISRQVDKLPWHNKWSLLTIETARKIGGWGGGGFIECTICTTANVSVGFCCFTIFVQIQSQRIHIIVKTKRAHCVKNVFAVDCFAFFILATFTRFGCYKWYEFGHTLLYAFTRLFCNLNQNKEETCWDTTLLDEFI